MATQITTVPGFSTGDDTISTDLLQDFSIDGLAGDDNITLEEAASNFTLRGSGGDDLIKADSDVSATSLLKGGASDDTFQFAGAVAGSSIYGGKGADSLYFARTVTGGLVAGDTGADRFTFMGKVSGGATISGGNGDDSFVINERLTETTVLGGESRDSVDINENSADSKIATGTDNDVVLVTGKHSNLKVKTGSGDDTIDIEASTTGTGNKFYAGKGEDSIELNTTASVAVYADNDDDVILFQAVALDNASAFGGEGADTINMRLVPANSTSFVKGNAGDDVIRASDVDADTIATSVYGGQGDDTISSDLTDANVAAGSASNANYFFYGDKGDDVLYVNSNEQSLLSGGIGADSITLVAASTDTDKPHTVIGGAGVDTITVAGIQTLDHGYGTTTTLRYLPDDAITTLTYGSFSEFFANGDIVDAISISGDNQAITAEVAENLTFTDADVFDRANYNSAARTATREGLIISTASTVTAGSSVVFDAAAADYVFGIDVSAGTTGDTSIDVSAETNASLGMLLKGSSGRNTIKGTAGLDVIYGGKNDVLAGNGAADVIFASDGKDSVDGGAGNDTIDFATNLTFQDTVIGGGDTDELRYKAASATVTTDLDNVSEIESIVLGDATTKIVLTDDIAVSSAVTISADALDSTSVTLHLDADAEDDGTVTVIGGNGNDTVTGTDNDDKFTMAEGADSIVAGTGSDVVVIPNAAFSSVDFSAGAAAVAATGDIITGLTNGAGTADKLDMEEQASGQGLAVAAAANLAAGGAITNASKGVLVHNATLTADAFENGAVQADFITEAAGIIMTAGAGVNNATTSDVLVAFVGAQAAGGAGTEDLGLFAIDHALGSTNIAASEITFVGVVTGFGSTLTNGFIA